MNIICFGDSITSAKNFSEGDRWPTILQYRLNEWKPGRYAVYNRGIGGHTSAQGLERMAEDVLPLFPGLLLVQFGFNDSNIRSWSQIARVSIHDYAANLSEFFRIAHTYQSQCVFIVNHPILRDSETHRMPNGQTYSVNYQPYHDTLCGVIETLIAPSINLPNIMKKRRLSADALLSEDGLHLSASGNYLYAEMVFESLKSFILEKES